MRKLRNLLRRGGPVQSPPASSPTAEISEHRPSSSPTSIYGPQIDVRQVVAAAVQSSASPTSLGSIAITKGTNYGISVLFDAGPKALVDIIFVHGLTGNAYNTWLHKDSQTHWPSILLQQDLPDSRVLSFGYDADIVNFWSPASQSRLGNHAEDMVGELVRLRERSKTEQRKIMFVAHSLGGLVVEYALSHSRNSYETHLHQIERFTYGIAFLGTPHHGSDLVKWGKFGTDIASIVRRPNKDIVAVLSPGSEVLDQVENGFYTILRKRKDEGREIAITCFWEELPVAVIGHVVPLYSAKMQGYSCYGINANHMDMTKFPSRADRGYNMVLGELLRWKNLSYTDAVKKGITASRPALYQITEARGTTSVPKALLNLTQEVNKLDIGVIDVVELALKHVVSGRLKSDAFTTANAPYELEQIDSLHQEFIAVRYGQHQLQSTYLEKRWLLKYWDLAETFLSQWLDLDPNGAANVPFLDGITRTISNYQESAKLLPPLLEAAVLDSSLSHSMLEMLGNKLTQLDKIVDKCCQKRPLERTIQYWPIVQSRLEAISLGAKQNPSAST